MSESRVSLNATPRSSQGRSIRGSVRHRPPSPRLTSPHVWRSSRTEGLQALMSQVSSGESLYHHLHCLWVPITTARRFHLPLGQLGCHTPHRIALVLHLTDNRLKPLRTVQGLAAVFWCEDSGFHARGDRGYREKPSAEFPRNGVMFLVFAGFLHRTTAEIGALNAKPVRWEATALPLSYTRAR